ncbi:MAG TPA: ParB/RepB/Spo0J family partition protein [Trebonia sp.]
MTLLDVASAVQPDDNFADDSIEAIDQIPVCEIPLSALSDGFLLRVTGTDPAHVQMLSEVASFNEIPPILVQRKSLRIIDGAHRMEAAKARGENTIRARLVNCTDNSAYILAVKANTLHGLPLSRADRVSSAQRILGWHPDWSDRAIGIATGLSAKTVAGIRRDSAGNVQQFAKRLGRDGKRRPVTALEGRKRAAEYITARPEASLREVARETDVSLGTVQDVRARMRRGLDPLTAGGGSRALTAAPEPAARPRPEPPAGAPAGAPVLLSARLGRIGRPGAPAPSWPEIFPKLAGDPSLRYTEGGRAFIRWMTARMSNPHAWREFTDSIPAHWLRDISTMAEQASEDWRDFAEHLRSRQDEAV